MYPPFQTIKKAPCAGTFEYPRSLPDPKEIKIVIFKIPFHCPNTGYKRNYSF